MKNILYIIIFLSVGMLSAQTPMTLEKAISIGLQNNYDVQVSDINIRIAENNNSWAIAGRKPQISLNGNINASMTVDSLLKNIPEGNRYNISGGVSLDGQWSLINGGRVEITKSQLEKIVEQEQLNKQTIIHELLRNIQTDYYSVLLEIDRYEALEDIFNLSKDRYRYELTKKEFGASNSYNLIQFETAILTDSTNLVSQELQIDVAKRQLYTTLDLSTFENFTFTEKLNYTDESISKEKLKSTLSEENYTLKTLMVVDELNTLNTALQETNNKFQLNLTAGIGINGTHSELLTGTNFFFDQPFNFLSLNPNVGLNFSKILSDGGINDINIQNARLQEELNRVSIEQAVAELNNQLDILIENYKVQQELVLLIDNQIQVARKNLTMTEERFKAGLITSLDFRNVQNQYLNIAFSRINAIYNLLLTKTEIDFLVGKYES